MPPAQVGKSVRFEQQGDELANTIHKVPCRTDMDAIEFKSLFFDKEDYRTARSAARRDSLEVERNGSAQQLQMAFGVKSKASQEQLNCWTTANHGCRGLERWANKIHGEKRQIEQFAAVMAILRAQDDMINANQNIDRDALRRIATKSTRNARHFARMMGKADSYAVGLELKTSNTAAKDSSTPQWDSSTLVGICRMNNTTTTDEETSVADSAAESTISSVTRLTSMLDVSSKNSDMDEDTEDMELLLHVDEVPDGTTELSSTPKTKTKKLRLLKKLRRRMSLSSNGVSSAGPDRRPVQ